MIKKSKLRKLIKKLRHYVDASYRDQPQKRQHVLEMLAQLRKRSKALERVLKTQEDPALKEKLNEELQLMKAQRKKMQSAIKRIKDDTQL